MKYSLIGQPRAQRPKDSRCPSTASSPPGVERRMPGPTQLDDLLARQRVVLLDGGLATELERRGADLDDPLWSARLLLDAPDLIRQVHVDYYAAGADIATTASYQASFEGGRGSASRVGTASTSARGSRWPNASTRSKAVHRSWLSASTARRRGTFPRWSRSRRPARPSPSWCIRTRALRRRGKALARRRCGGSDARGASGPVVPPRCTVDRRLLPHDPRRHPRIARLGRLTAVARDPGSAARDSTGQFPTSASARGLHDRDRSRFGELFSQRTAERSRSSNDGRRSRQVDVQRRVLPRRSVLNC